MRHLFSTRAEVLRLTGIMQTGTPTITWLKILDIVDEVLGIPGELMCRLDLAFIRQGKDAPMPIVAGRAPDRFGTMIFGPTDQIKAGDRLRTLSGPVQGTFEIRAIPDPAQALADVHHMEVQVIEVSQSLAGTFPGGEVEQ